ncbi:hypothetical protein XELAEV_18028452mg [Xenopus laevis]|uniref:Uncharacterized protein n=1 Tax=Xenopus laevis TaxID=8355 RepID=A0A974CYC2_XENLA|nr:hypothetical protein XELAEV_18028452mg [Xenopus laevis]
MLPIRIPNRVMKVLQTKIMKFIWASKSHRIAGKVLTTPLGWGGLGAPDIPKFYVAAQLRQAWKASVCVAHKEITQRYMTPTKLHSIYPTSTTSCCGEEGALYRIVWTLLEDYWKGVMTLLEPILGQSLCLDPQTLLLGKPFPRLKKYVQKQANLIVTVAKWLIAHNWKKPESPTGLELKTSNIRRMEYLAGLHCSQLLNVDKVWSQWESLIPIIT